MFSEIQDDQPRNPYSEISIFQEHKNIIRHIVVIDENRYRMGINCYTPSRTLEGKRDIARQRESPNICHSLKPEWRQAEMTGWLLSGIFEKRAAQFQIQVCIWSIAVPGNITTSTVQPLLCQLPADACSTRTAGHGACCVAAKLLLCGACHCCGRSFPLCELLALIKPLLAECMMLKFLQMWSSNNAALIRKVSEFASFKVNC